MARCALRERSDGTQACIPRSERRREPGVLAAHLERLAPVRHVANAGLPQQVQRTALATWVQSVQPSAHSACRLAASQREQESRDPLKMITARARFLGVDLGKDKTVMKPLYLPTAAQLSGGRVGGNAQAPFGGVGALCLRASIVRRVPALSLGFGLPDLFARWA